jgi:Xaa-Pro aminopeptidase
MTDAALVREKVAQARDAVAAAEADCWLTFARETTEIAEPCLPYLLGFDVVWPTMVLVTPERSVVVIGRHDAPNAEALDVHEVEPYDESLAGAFHEFLDAESPSRLAVNFSRDNNVADGLTHGLYRRLEDLLHDRESPPELVSADPIVSEVRGVKSATEHDRIREAAAETETLLTEATAVWTPEWTEAAFSDWCHDWMDERGYGTAWSRDYCPTVHTGGDAEVGHTLPGDRTLPAGEVLHVDVGVTVDGYAADIQRLYYWPGEADEPVPEGLAEAYADVRAAIDAGHEVLEAGVVGHAVDDAAREELTERGWPAYQHAFGHQVGRNAHDGGALLGPRWDRYGDQPDRQVRVGEVYTMELGVDTEWGYLGQEEMVRVTEDGTEFVVEPQTELRTLSA